MTRLRLVTYNIHKAKGLDGKVMPSRIARVLRSLNADVIALQEVVNVDGREPDRHQGRFIAEELGMNWALGSNRELHGGDYGNVLLSRFPIETHCNYDITVKGREQRGCLRADVCHPAAGTLHVFNVHLGTSFFERRHQGRRLVEEELLRSRSLVGPRVVMGDFNEWTQGLATQILYNEFQCADIRLQIGARATYPGVMPLVHLDHIYYDQTLQLESVGIHRTRHALIASDHLPIWADVVWS